MLQGGLYCGDRAAVSIAGISDLLQLEDEGHHWMFNEVMIKQIGTDRAKLKRDSPRLHAADFRVPLLLLHGTLDAQVPFEQSKGIAAALTSAGKPVRFIQLKDADHSLSAVSDRVTMLRAVEAFLSEELSVAGAAEAASGSGPEPSTAP
jgi:dipeptidyl aminopeptidase/acylaminoacyl peptidase